MNKSIISITTATLVSVLAVAGITYAATPSGASTASFDSLIIGAPGTGGVTQFNGTMVNIDANKPLTAGDDFRIDGRVWRGANPGPALGDNQPFIINDDTQVAGTFTVGGTDIFAAIDAKGDKFDVQSNASNIAVNTSNISTNTTNILANTTNIANNASSISAKANTADVVTKASPSWNARTGSVFLDATSVLPADEAVEYDISGLSSVLTIDTAANTDVDFYIPVNLPKGVTLTNVTLSAGDTNTNVSQDINARLYSSDYTALFTSVTELAHVFTGGLVSSLTSSVAAHASATIDPEIYRYYIKVDFVDDGAVGDMFFNGVLVEYTYTEPY